MLSLYLYGDLDFAQEDELERHLNGCELCRIALAREKAWHAVLNSERRDAPWELLSECRRDLKAAVAELGPNRKLSSGIRSRWFESFGFSAPGWSMKLALASFLVFIGFSAGRYIDRNGLPGGAELGNIATAGLIGSPNVHIRDIQPGDNNRVRIIVDQVQEREVTGQIDDQGVRELLLAAAKDPSDPGIRVDSVEILNGQNGNDIRDALLNSVRRDPNAAVRLKALEGLRRFTDDPATRDTLKFVLEHDNNAGVRSEAIDALLPANRSIGFNPDLARTLQDVMRSEQDDDYVRMRCLQVLSSMRAQLGVY